MPALEIFAVYNKWTGRIDIVKSKKLAERVCATYNKLYNLLNSPEIVFSKKADQFFKTHPIDKNNIHFAWDIKFNEKIEIFQEFYKKN